MRVSNAVIWLASLVVALALFAAGIGLLYEDAGRSYSFASLRGVTVQIYGHGLYRYDTVLIATGNRAGDAVTRVWAVPLLAISIWLYRRGSLRGGLLVAGTLARISTRLPNRGIGVFLIISGSVLLIIWLVLSIIPALLADQTPPEVATYTTVITFVVDMAVVAPALILSGALVFRQAAWGYLLAPVMLIFSVSLGISITVFGIAQFLVGLVTLGQFMGFVIPFTVLTLVSIWFAVLFLRSCSDSMPGSALHS